MLELRDLAAGYGPALVLRGVTLNVATGTVTALMGRNGTGKTTLCRAVMGLLRPAGGSIRFDGAEVAGLAPHEIARRGVGYVPQGRGIFDRFTVDENLELGLAARGGGRVPADVFDWFPKLAALRRRVAGTLSGGEQQTLAIARALVAEPRLLVLDEPSEGLQPSAIADIAELLLPIVTARRLTVFLVEHNLELVRRIAGVAAFLVDGTVVGSAVAGDLAADSPILHQHLGP